MADSNLVDFVKAALERGESRENIRSVLKSAGWPGDQIDNAIGAFADIDFPVPVPTPRRYGSAREAFLYIVYFTLLGVVATQLGVLAFAWIDVQFADVLDNHEYGRWRDSGLRWAISSLLVGYPIFVFLGWRLAAAKRRDAERRRSRVHAWLTYITLIFAACTLIGDLVAVVFEFLSGEIGARFMAKALVVGVISAAILWNYSRDVERQSGSADMAGRVLAIAASVVVAVLVAWGFTLVKSPQAARSQRIDEQRLEHLVAITRLVDCHYTYAGAIPENLDAMDAYLRERSQRLPSAPGCARDLPIDPKTKENYSYREIDEGVYELCVEFETGWPDEEGYERDWRAGGSYGYPDELSRRVLQKPSGPGAACFKIEAARIEEKEPTTIDADAPDTDEPK